MRIMAAMVPYKKNGLRRPILFLHLSETAPKNGSRNRASTLSMAMIRPEKVSSRWKVLVSTKGITALYICQNAQMLRKPKPICTVFLTSNLILYSPRYSPQLSLESHTYLSETRFRTDVLVALHKVLLCTTLCRDGTLRSLERHVYASS